MAEPVVIVGLALAISIIILNISEIIILCRRKRKLLYETLLVSLSVSDLCLGLGEFSVNIVIMVGVKDNSPNYVYMTYFFFLVVSVLLLLFISIDRLHAVAYPIHHKTHQRGRTTKYLIVSSWTVSFIMTGGYVINYFVNNFHIKYTSKSQYCDVIVSMITYILIIANVLYIIIYSVIAYLIWSRRVILQGEDQIKKQIKKQRQGVILCTCTVLAFIAFTCPFSISYVLHPKLPNKWTLLALGANSAMNSIIFLLQEFIRNRVSQRKASSSIASNQNMMLNSSDL